MKHLLKSFALAALPATAIALAPVPAAAQSKLGIAVADLNAAINGTTAAQTASTQMQTTYKAQIDSINSRKSALEASLKTKGDALQAAAKAAGGKPTPALQTQYQDFQKSQADAQQELQTIGQPIALARAYVEEQITAKLNDALKSAMNKAKVDLVISPEATISYQPTVDITSRVTAELNALVPSVNIVPPAGWQPGGQGQQQAAPAAAAPAAQQPTGR